MTDPQVGMLMLGLFIFIIMLGFPIAFTLMAMGVGFGFYAYYVPARKLFRTASSRCWCRKHSKSRRTTC
jgi:TRAP-type mannitol/chloroaromatic compound transport system permease large subunit